MMTPEELDVNHHHLTTQEELLNTIKGSQVPMLTAGPRLWSGVNGVERRKLSKMKLVARGFLRVLRFPPHLHRLTVRPIK